MKWTMKAPCANCPFKREGGIRLRPERAEEISDMMLDRAGGTFPCHKTLNSQEAEYDEPVEGLRISGPNEVHCAGALIFAEKNDNATQMMRIAGRLGMYDPEKLDMDADVFDSQHEMIKANRKG